MIRLLHLVPITVIIAAVTAALAAHDRKSFPKDFLKAAGWLLALFVGLAAGAVAAGYFL